MTVSRTLHGRSFRSAILVTLVALISGGLGYLVSLKQRPPPHLSIAELDPQIALSRLLSFQFAAIDGRLIRMSDWRNKILIINYWATWCPPCLEEMPAFSALQRKYASKGVQFVGISIDDVAKVRQFNERTTISYPLLLGSMASMEVAVALGNQAQGLPFTIIVTPQGTVDSVKLGRLSDTELENRLRRLLHQ